MNSAKWISKRLMQVVALGLLTGSPLLADPSHAATVNWADATGFWDIAANWSSTPLLPAAADDVVINVAGVNTVTHRLGTDTINSLSVSGSNILSIPDGGLTVTGTYNNTSSSSGSTDIAGGTLTLNGASTLNSLTESSGALGGTGIVTVSGAATWSGGGMSGTGTTTFNSTLAITGDTEKTSGRTVNTAGTTTWGGNTVAGGNEINGGTFNNTGTWNDTNAFAHRLVGGAAFNNTPTGSYIKTGASITDIVGGVAFNNTGIVNVNAGTLRLSGGGTSSGSFAMAAGATLDFDDATHNLNAVTTSGAGTFQISGGTVNMNGGTHTSLFLLSGSGNLSAAGNVAISGPATWTGGSIAGTATTTFNSTLAITGDAEKTISGTVNAVSTTWSGNTVALGNEIFFNGGTFNNTGTFTETNAFDNRMSGGGTFNNTGTYNKQTNILTTVNPIFNNTGTVNVNSGTLRLQGGGTSTGSFTMAAGATLDFDNATHNLNAVTTSGAGTFQISGGTVNMNGGTHTSLFLLSGSGNLSAAGNVTISGPATWTGGGIAGAATTTFNTLAITGNSSKTISGPGTVNAGSTIWSGNTGANGNEIFFNGGHFTNTGTFTDTNVLDNLMNGGGTFHNAGTYNKQNATLTFVNPTFNNTGIVNINAGTLSFHQGVQGPTGTVQVASGATYQHDAASTVGNLITAGTLALSNQNITVFSDYNNANFGVGDGFNRRANVTGTGLIVAAANAAQAITGANVTGGTTATPTLVIGNVHVGDNTYTYQVANTGTTGPSIRGALQTGVNGGSITDSRLSGSGVTAGNFGPIATGANSGDFTVTFTTTSAGAVAPLPGQKVNVINNFDNLGSQLLTIGTAPGATAYRLAQANSIAAVNFGSVHVGDTVQQGLTISNLAPNDGFSEKLNASFGAVTDSRITTSGSISLLAPGATNNSSMVVGLNTSAAGTVNGTARVNLQSDGTGTSGLGTTALPSQNVGVSGDIQTIGQVFRLAQPSAHSPEPVNLGNARVGGTAQQALTISNLAPNDGFSEKLNASIGGATAGVTASGAFTLLPPGAPGNPAATNSTSLVVGLNTATAGAKAGTAIITLASDGTGTSGLGITSLGTQTVNVSGSVYRLANPTLNTPAVTLVARVGDASPTAAVSVTNTSPDAFTEGLKATISATPPVFTASGSIANLAAGATSASALQVGLQTGTAGSFSGTATVPFTSTGAGTTGASDLSLGNGTVTLSGKVYTPAQAQVPTPSVDFGIVHKGDVVALKPVEVRNTAPVTALNDVLQGSFTGVSTPFTATGTLGAGVAAGTSDATSLKVGIGTGIAGLFNGSATLGLASHNADLTDLALSPVNLTLTGQVNNFAKLDLTKLSGAGSFSKSGSTFLLDFGTLLSNGGVSTALFGLDNTIPSGEPSDLLDVLFGLNAPDFLLTGFGPHNNIAAGQEITGLSIGFDAAMRAQGFDEFITLMGRGHNGSGFSGDLAPITLELRASIQQPGGAVPEPATLALVLTGIVFFGAMHMLRRIRAR